MLFFEGRGYHPRGVRGKTILSTLSLLMIFLGHVGSPQRNSLPRGNAGKPRNESEGVHCPDSNVKQLRISIILSHLSKSSAY